MDASTEWYLDGSHPHGHLYYNGETPDEKYTNDPSWHRHDTADGSGFYYYYY